MSRGAALITSAVALSIQYCAAQSSSNSFARSIKRTGLRAGTHPDEFVWTQAKRELSNFDHGGLVPLMLHVVRSLQRIGRSQALLQSCLHASDLPWP
jgi:hypothetical protein